MMSLGAAYTHGSKEVQRGFEIVDQLSAESGEGHDAICSKLGIKEGDTRGEKLSKILDGLNDGKITNSDAKSIFKLLNTKFSFLSKIFLGRGKKRLKTVISKLVRAEMAAIKTETYSRQFSQVVFMVSKDRKITKLDSATPLNVALTKQGDDVSVTGSDRDKTVARNTRNTNETTLGRKWVDKRVPKGIPLSKVPDILLSYPGGLSDAGKHAIGKARKLIDKANTLDEMKSALKKSSAMCSS